MAPFDIERDRYEARLKYQRDLACYIADAREEGFKQGFEEGLKKVREERRQEGHILQARMVILRVLKKRFGEPPHHIVSELNAITSLDRLNELVDRALDCPTWDDLLSDRSA